MSKYQLVSFIILVAFLLRALFPTFGSPVLYTIPDEVPNYLAAFEMLSKKTLVTSSQYPPFGSYILLPFYLLAYIEMKVLGIVSNLAQFELFLLTHEGYFLFIPRIFSSLFGTASLWLVYKMAKLVFPAQPQTIVWAVLLTAFSLTHIQLSHIGKPWMTSQFFYLLGIYWAIKALISNRVNMKLVVLASLSSVLALGFHFSALYGLLFLFFLFLFYRQNIFSSKKMLAIAFVLFGIPLLSLFFYKILMSYTYQVSEFQNIFSANIANGILTGLWFYCKEFFLTEPILLIGIVLSLVFFKSVPKLFRVFYAFSIIYFLIIALTFYQSLRYILPILPFLSVVGAFGINKGLKKINSKPLQILVTTFLLFSLIAPPFVWLVRWGTPPTFIESHHWINKHITQTEPLATTAVRFSPFVPNAEAISLMQREKPHAWERLSRYQTSGIYSETVRNIVYLEVVIDAGNDAKIIEYMHSHEFKYLIQPYWNPSGRLIEKNPEKWKLVRQFNPKNDSTITPLTNLIHGSANMKTLLEINKLGPFIDILEFIPNE